MNALIDLINQYEGADILIILILTFLAIKGVYEAYKWCKGLSNSWYEDRKKREENERAIQTRMDTLEVNTAKQQETLDKLTVAIDNISHVIDEMKKEDLESWIDKVRWNIMTSAQRLRSGQKLSNEQYRVIFENYQKYERIIRENGITNGVVDASIAVIRQHYISDPDVESSDDFEINM